VTVYLDHNATTPVDSEVLEEMLPFLKGTFGNPSSIHAFGQGARRGLDFARERVAGLIGAAPEEIVFTSGGTESDNHAIAGVFDANRSKGQHIITTAIEHQAVLSVCHGLEQKGARVTYVGVDRQGTVSPGEVMDAVADDTVLISVMLANNDVGTIQPVREIAEAAHERGVLVHCDAVQAVGKIPVAVADIEADMISVSSHKLYGPKGAGALFIKKGTRLAPLVLGGHHESRRRAGTENVPAIVGFGKACDLAKGRFVADAERIRVNRDRLQNHITEKIDRVHIHGHPTNRLPGTLNVGFEEVEGETLLIALDLKGIAVSTGSACSSDSRDPSHVLAAMGCHPYLASCSIRFSLGRGTTAQEIDEVGQVLPELIDQLRSN
jgi:cysteine desulfurase